MNYESPNEIFSINIDGVFSTFAFFSDSKITSKLSSKAENDRKIIKLSEDEHPQGFFSVPRFLHVIAFLRFRFMQHK